MEYNNNNSVMRYKHERKKSLKIHVRFDLCISASSSTSSTLRSPLRHLQEVVSEEMRNERVGRWIRTQINQDYGNELPMG